MTAAIILAGGLGTRLRSVVPDLPKPMAPIADRPFLAYQLDYWIAQGIRQFVLSVGYRHEAIIDYFGHSYEGAQLDYAIESRPLGTGGGVLLAMEKLDDEPFLLLNGDTYFAVNLAKLTEFARTSGSQWCLSLFRTDQDGRYMGLDVSPQGRILSLKSGSGQVGRLANGGVYYVDPRALRSSGLVPGERYSLEDDILPAALAAGQSVHGVECEGTFIDIGVPDDYRRAPSLLVSQGGGL